MEKKYHVYLNMNKTQNKKCDWQIKSINKPIKCFVCDKFILPITKAHYSAGLQKFKHLECQYLGNCNSDNVKKKPKNIYDDHNEYPIYHDEIDDYEPCPQQNDIPAIMPVAILWSSVILASSIFNSAFIIRYKNNNQSFNRNLQSYINFFNGQDMILASFVTWTIIKRKKLCLSFYRLIFILFILLSVTVRLIDPKFIQFRSNYNDPFY